MPEPHPNLQSFIAFTNASDRSRSNVLRRIREQSSAEYSPATDYWKRMRDAVKSDRRTSRDGSAVFAAAADATEKKRDSFSRVATRWQEFLPRWTDSRYVPPQAGVADIAGLEVSVSPRFIEAWSNGFRERTFVYFNAAKLTQPTLDIALRVMQLAYPDEANTGAVLLDVQRGHAHVGSSHPERVIDEQLMRLADEFRSTWAA
jgi:hypothetical protein